MDDTAGGTTELETFANMLPMREWLAIERAALLADAGANGEAELVRYTAGYDRRSIGPSVLVADDHAAGTC